MSHQQTTTEEAAPFLDHPEDDIEKRVSLEIPLSDYQKKSRSWCAVLFHILLTLLNILWLAANVIHSTAPTVSLGNHPNFVVLVPQAGYPNWADTECEPEPIDAPIEMEIIRWDLPAGKRSNFTSFNREIADAAWKTRGIGSNQGWLKVSKEDLEAMGETSVEFSDGSGYLMYMDVFHQLHCLNYLRKKLDPWKAAYSSVPSDENFPERYHTAHCIDSIRLSLECHGDLSLVPQRWADGWGEPWPVVESLHVCRNYDKIQEWAHSRQPNVTGLLVHPKLGKVVTGHLNASALPVYWEDHDEI